MSHWTEDNVTPLHVQRSCLTEGFISMEKIVPSLVFITHGQVHWGLGVALAVGNALGAWAGSNLAINKGDQWIKAFLFVAVIVMAAKLLGMF